MVSWGTLSQAVYLAYEREPKNNNARESIAAGLSRVSIFREDTPEDVILWLKDFHNVWNTGSNYSFWRAADHTI